MTRGPSASGDPTPEAVSCETGVPLAPRGARGASQPQVLTLGSPPLKADQPPPSAAPRPLRRPAAEAPGTRLGRGQRRGMGLRERQRGGGGVRKGGAARPRGGGNRREGVGPRAPSGQPRARVEPHREGERAPAPGTARAPHSPWSLQPHERKGAACCALGQRGRPASAAHSPIPGAPSPCAASSPKPAILERNAAPARRAPPASPGAFLPTDRPAQPSALEPPRPEASAPPRAATLRPGLAQAALPAAPGELPVSLFPSARRAPASPWRRAPGLGAGAGGGSGSAGGDGALSAAWDLAAARSPARAWRYGCLA